MTDLFTTTAQPKFILRDYQVEAITAGISFFKEPVTKKVFQNGIIICPTGSGKSLIIACIINGLQGKTIVLQPSKEILEQNHKKLQAYGYHAAIYSASLNKKQVGKITFATIGSVVNVKQLFADFDHIIADECHLINSFDGQYKKFIDSLENVRVLGLTATPYRLSSSSWGSMLKFITRTRTKIFKRVLYYVQNRTLFDAGHLAKLEYFSLQGFDRTKLKKNSTGAAYTDKSVQQYHQLTHFDERLRKVVQRLIDSGRKSILVFTQLVDEARALSKLLYGCRAEFICSDKKVISDGKRAQLLDDFKSGKITVMCNVGILTTGFDYEALDTVVLGRATMSLALYYQMVGRGMRPHPSKKSCYVVDLCGNIELFGAIEDIYIGKDEAGLWQVTNRGKPLTNVLFGEGKPSYLD